MSLNDLDVRIQLVRFYMKLLMTWIRIYIYIYMTHDGAQQNDGSRRTKSFDLQPSHKIDGVGDILPVDRMTDQFNYEEDEEDQHNISTVQSTIPKDILERPPNLGDAENIKESVEINGMMDELF